jgi:hypothetical protein
MNDRHEAIKEFWRWFQAHREEFYVLTDTAAPFWDVALGQLQRLDKRLWFELSMPDDDDDREFIITVEGHADIFPLADAIIALAPQISGWQLIALKPPMGFDFTTTYEGIRFEPRAMWFLPLDSSSRPEDLGLRVGVPNFTDDIKRQASNAVAVILDTALGERAAALDIQHLEVSALPESPESHGYIELYELPTYIESRKRRNRSV